MGETALLIEKIAGTPTANYSCAVFNKKVNLPSGDLGTLAGCILAQGDDSEAIAIASRDVFDLFPKKLEISEEGILETLESAKEAAIKYLAGQDYQISFVFAFFFKEACFIVRLGDLVKVLVFDPPKSDEITFEGGSGPARVGQLYLIATARFLENFDVSGFAQNVDIDYGELVDGLATDITVAEGAGALGAVFIYLKGGEEKAESIEEEGPSGAEELVSPGISGGDRVVESEQDLQKKPQRRLNFGPVKGFGAGILKELKRLRRGDLGAIARLRQHVMLIVIGVVLVLALSVVFTLWQNQKKAKEMEFASHMAAASAKYNEGVSLLELNKVRARQDFVDAQNEVALAVNIHKDDAGAKKLASDISSKLKETDVTANISFSDVASAPSNINAIAFVAKNVVAVTSDKLYTVDISSKSAGELKGASGGISATVFDNKAFVLTSSGIVRQDLAGGTPTKINVSAGGQDIGVFFGNVYVLSTGKIAKIVPVEGGYAPETDYLTVKTDFLPSSRFAIDGSIWVTRSDKILKFTRGNADNFTISGLSGKLGELGPIYTGATLGDLYVLDKTNSALLVISKDGTYKKAYQASEFARAADILVTDDASTLYVAVDGKVVSASIK